MSTRRNPGTDVALIAAFAALVAVCALLPAIKVAGPVPITLQTFAVLLSGAVLGMRRGFLVTYVARDRRTRALVVFACSITASILVIHVLGILGMKLYFDVSFPQALAWDMPFWLGDVVKTALVAMIAAEVHRAFPQLLQRD